MIIEFEKIRFKNINSFGNSWTEFFFKPGLNIVTGKIGSGKSTFLTNVLSFNIFGKPYSDIRIEELINNKNGKNLDTESYFKVDNDSYCIQRGLKPNTLKIIKNNEEMELLSHKSLIQDEINKIIGVNHNLFKQIISLSLQNNKPFLSLDAKEKREITESIFNIKVFGRMLKSLKKNNSITKNSIELTEKEITLSKENLENLVNQIKSLTKLKNEFDDNKKKDIQDQTTKRDLIEKEIMNIQKMISELNFEEKTFDDVVKNLLKEEKDKTHKHWIHLHNRISSIKQEIDFIEDSFEDDFERKYSELRELVSSFYEFIKQLEDDHKKKISEIEIIHKKKVLENNLSLQKLESRIPEHSKEKSFLTKDYIEKNLTEIIDKKKILTENKIKISNLKDDVALLKTTEGVCSHCMQEVSEDHKLKEIETRNNSMKSLITENDILIAEMESIISNHIREKTKQIEEKVKVNKDEISELKKTIQDSESKHSQSLFLLESGCRTAIQELKDKKEEVVSSYVRAHKETLTKDLESLEREIEKNHDDSETLDSKLKLLENDEKEYTEKKHESINLSLQLGNEKKNLHFVLSDIKKLDEKEFTADIESLKSDFETKKKNYQELKSKNESQKRKLKIEEVIKEVLDEQGIKKYFFSRLVPKLNQTINEYLNHFELPVIFKFDEMFEYEIKEVGNKERTYESFSGGEKFILSFSIILSFGALNKLINNFSCNIQNFDELLDNGLDHETLEGVLEKIKDLTDKNNMSTYIISHRPIESSEYVDHIVKLEKKSGFSRIIA